MTVHVQPTLRLVFEDGVMGFSRFAHDAEDAQLVELGNIINSFQADQAISFRVIETVNF